MLLVFHLPASGQDTFVDNRFNYGVSIDAKLELVCRYGYLTNFRLGISGGSGYYINEHVMPFSQVGISFFQGGIGSSISVSQRNKFNVEIYSSTGIVGGWQSKWDIPRPLYTLGKFASTPIQLPYSFYLNLATTFVQRISKNSGSKTFKHGRFSQRVGSGVLGVGPVEINYYNDGMPYHFLGLGDNKDRFYTGGGFINITPNYNCKYGTKVINDFYAGFDRFTGYFPESFELAYALHLNEVPYRDLDQAYYNKGRFFIGSSFNQVKGLNTVISINDHDGFDVQNWIHNGRQQPFHKTLHKTNFGINTFYSNPVIK